MSNGKITYIMGAGASANALPVLSNFATEVGNTKRIFDKWQYGNDGEAFRHKVVKDKDGNPTQPGHHIIQSAIAALETLHQVCLEHTTVDTHCRMLNLTGAKERDRSIKNALTLFFQLSSVRPRLQEYFNKETDIYRPIDLRYDSFFASVISKHYDELPEDINVLTWNYDDQFERAYGRYLKTAGSRNEHPEVKLGVYSKFTSDQRVDDFDSSRFFYIQDKRVCHV